MTPINFNAGYQMRPQRPNPQMNPDVYAQQYANQHGLSLEDAKTQLSSRYGEPEKPSFFSSNTSESSMVDYNNFDFGNLGIEDSELQEEGFSIMGLFQHFLDFLKGNQGPQQEGDPEHHLYGSDSIDGPQKEGDPQPHLNNGNGTDNADGPQKEGDPQPHLNPNGSITGPQQEGDYNPFGGMTIGSSSSTSSKSNPFGKDPDTYAQEYADEKGITLEEAKRQLKALYGDPSQMI